ncbi:MAG TPA: heparin lyase I family protein [Thermoanaerobaculia bacterium]|nr:heparin lyase I family protein [Thermoanaerobaculia bacterium]
MHDSPALAWPRALLGLAALLVLAAAARDGPRRPGVWFRGDFEQGSLEGWHGDLARPGSAVVVTRPVRRGRHAVRIELAPGDRAADKPRAELKLADKTIERRYGAPGGEVWYGWTDLVFHVRWSEGLDGFVEAWLDGRPFTEGRAHGRNLYGPVANYLRLGFYRGKGVQATQHVYLDEVRLGGSYFAVAP